MLKDGKVVCSLVEQATDKTSMIVIQIEKKS